MLTPVEHPRGIAVRAAYVYMGRQFGKVFTSIKVFNARMPTGFLFFYGKVSRLDKKLVLPQRTAVAIRDLVASINGCSFCMDAARYYALRQSPSDAARLDELAEYRTSNLFDAAERAAFDYATELTRDRRVDPATAAALKARYSEREICDIVWLVASEHLYNMTNIGLNIGSDGLCELAAPRR